MQFGTNIMVTRPFGVSPAPILTAWVDDAVEAERLGYHSAWCTEHHFASDPDYRPFGLTEREYPPADYDLAPDPMTLLGWAAARTKKLHVGTAVSILHWDHPIRTVERAAMLDALSGGRLMLGVGRGLGFREADVFGVPSNPQGNEKRYHEALSIIRQAWSGEYFSFEGEYYNIPKLCITPQPDRQPAPIYVGSASNNSAIWAAKNDLPYATITWPLVDFNNYKEKRRAYLAAGEAAGFEIGRHLCPHFLYMYCGESDQESAEMVDHYMTQFQCILEHHYELNRNHHQNEAVRGSHETGFRRPAEALSSMRDLTKGPIEFHIVGNPQTCIERVRAYEQEVGANYMVLNMGFGCMPREKRVASMRRFAEHVMPHFR
jgi:alkanesulfonate monooxygenase SsuD/methylene tetrahydromethanopterin reductase-like flavin-dependent oxidoreductase (luciferase family)